LFKLWFREKWTGLVPIQGKSEVGGTWVLASDELYVDAMADVSILFPQPSCFIVPKAAVSLLHKEEGGLIGFAYVCIYYFKELFSSGSSTYSRSFSFHSITLRIM
jgi:hypothetical protein